MAGIKINLNTLEARALIKLLQLARDNNTKVTANFFTDSDSYELNKVIEPLYFKMTSKYEDVNRN
jgi:hypothetical protein